MGSQRRTGGRQHTLLTIVVSSGAPARCRRVSDSLRSKIALFMSKPPDIVLLVHLGERHLGGTVKRHILRQQSPDVMSRTKA